jgi:UDP-N-acetylmuramoylalanine--D-glutamate ligase
MTIIILGMGVSGIASSNLSLLLEYRTIGIDKKPISSLSYEVKKLCEKGIEFYKEEDCLEILKIADLIVLSPGISNENEIVKKAEDLGKKIVSEIEFAFNFSKGKIIAITGSNGKSTTTSLINSIIKKKFADVRIGGNIGTSFSEIVLNSNERTLFVLEISSFQLERIEKFKPSTAILLNLTPDHQDRYKTSEDYYKAKMKIFENQDENDFAIVNLDDKKIVENLDTVKSRKFYFSQKRHNFEGAFVEDGKVYLQFKKEGIIEIVDSKDLKIKGPHNLENVMASSIAGYINGVEKEKIKEALVEFQSLPHRLEFVAEINGALFYNDSKATNVDSVKKALQSFEGNIVLLLGGRDKGADFSSLKEEVLKRCLKVVGFGEARKKVREVFKGKIEFEEFETLNEATLSLKERAKKGEIIVLSPACASFDEFKNFEDRGEKFKKWIVEGKNDRG